MPARAADPTPTPEAQLRAIVAQYPAAAQATFRSLRRAVRKRLPTIDEHFYDYRTSAVTSYTATAHGKDGVLSIALRKEGVRLYFGGGPKLPDPRKLLQGTGGARYIEIESARRLAHPDVEALIKAAILRSPSPLPRTGKGRLVDRATAQQARRS